MNDRNRDEMITMAQRLREIGMSEDDRDRLSLFTLAAKLEYGTANQPFPPLPDLIRPRWTEQ